MIPVDRPGEAVHYIYDHAAESETSNLLYFHPELVHMENLPDHWQDRVIGISGNDPKRTASAENTAQRLPVILDRLGAQIRDALDALQLG